MVAPVFYYNSVAGRKRHVKIWFAKKSAKHFFKKGGKGVSGQTRLSESAFTSLLYKSILRMLFANQIK